MDIHRILIGFNLNFIGSFIWDDDQTIRKQNMRSKGSTTYPKDLTLNLRYDFEQYTILFGKNKYIF